MSDFVKIKTAGALESQINRKIASRLEKKNAQIPGYRERLDFALRTRLASMRVVDHLRFKIYHRQFGGKSTVLVPTAVRTARLAVNGIKRIRGLWH